MNSKLKSLYDSKWNDLTDQIQHINNIEKYSLKPTNPLLLTINEKEYEEADIKIMFYGQETNSWGGLFDPDMQLTLDTYRDFYLSGFAMNGYGGHFWNGINRFKSLFTEKFPNKKLSLVWNNIIKIGNEPRNANRPPSYTYQVERDYFNVIKEEINILKPDILVFFTGPNYDNVIKDNFGDIEKHTVLGFSQRELVQLNIGSNLNAFRTYHPKYLWMNDINKYISAIINNIQLSQHPAFSKLEEGIIS